MADDALGSSPDANGLGADEENLFEPLSPMQPMQPMQDGDLSLEPADQDDGVLSNPFEQASVSPEAFSPAAGFNEASGDQSKKDSEAPLEEQVDTEQQELEEAEEGEVEMVEEGGEDEQEEAEEEGEVEAEESDGDSQVSAGGKAPNPRDFHAWRRQRSNTSKAQNLLEAGDESDQVSDEEEASGDKKELAKQGGIRSAASGATSNPGQAETVLRKRGRPTSSSKIAAMQSSQGRDEALTSSQIQQRESKLQKRVRFQQGEKVRYEGAAGLEDEESDDVDLDEEQGDSHEDDEDSADGQEGGKGDSKGNKQPQAQGGVGAQTGDQATGQEDYTNSAYRRNLGDFEEYVKMMSDEHISSAFEVFTQKRRKHVYQSLQTPAEEDRFNAFIEACPKKAIKKKLVELIDQLPGQKLKINEVVIQVITSAVKSHAGQLVEEAKKVQIIEIKRKLALKYPHKTAGLQKSGINLEGGASGQSMTPADLINGHCLSREAQEALVNEIRDMGPCLPHHLQEARRRLNQSDAAITERPKSMFLRKRFR